MKPRDVGQDTEQGRALLGHSLGIRLLVGAVIARQGGPVQLAGPLLSSEARSQAWPGSSGGNEAGKKRWGSWLGCTAIEMCNLGRITYHSTSVFLKVK